MKPLTDILKVYNSSKSAVVANVVLNGYSIQNEGPLGKQGSMRSFAIVAGDLWDSWSRQQMLVLQGADGKEAPIKVAALPVTAAGYGLIEFL